MPTEACYGLRPRLTASDLHIFSILISLSVRLRSKRCRTRSRPFMAKCFRASAALPASRRSGRGAGKTIMAGLLIKELVAAISSAVSLLRDRVRRWRAARQAK
jgi:hypothetical protein